MDYETQHAIPIALPTIMTSLKTTQFTWLANAYPIACMVFMQFFRGFSQVRYSMLPD